MKETCISILKKIKNNVVEKNLLKVDDRILLAFSGGQDSICLVFVFLQLKTQWNFDIGIICCQHLWQFESLYFFEYVVEILQFFHIPIFLSITLYPIVSEEKSRLWRYTMFSRIALFGNYKSILTGHSATDKLETCVFNFIRGSAIEGLVSLQWKRIVRHNNFFFENKKRTERIFYTDQLVKTIPRTYDYGLFLSDICIDTRYSMYIKNQKIRFEQPLSTILEFYTKSKFFIRKPASIPFQLSKKYDRKDTLKKIRTSKKSFQFDTNRKCTSDIFITKKKYSSRDTFFKKVCFPHSHHQLILQKFVNVKYKKRILFTNSYQMKALEYSLKQPFERILIRPFLNIHRIELYQLCLFWKLLIFEDTTNKKLKYYRNRIRKQLLPVLRYFFNPNVDTVLTRFSELVVSENLYLDFVSKKLYKIVTSEVESNKTKVVFDVSLLRYLPLALQRRLIKKILENFYNCRMNYTSIEKLLLILLKLPSKNLQSIKINDVQTYSVNAVKYLFLPQTGVILIFSQSIILIKSEY